MSLKAGLYQVRFVPKHVQCPFKGGQYATSTTINAPIRAEPHQSGASDQTWQVEPVQGQKGTYRITFPTLPEGPGVSHTSTGIVLPGWGVADRTRTPSDPVLLSVDIKEWVITATDAANNVFSIAEPFHGGIIGITSAVTEENNRLYVKPFVTEPFTLNQNKLIDPLPHWQFIPVSA